MGDYFSSLSIRERVLVGAAVLVGLVMVAYLYLWEPKMNQLRTLREQKIPQSEQTLAWVKQALSREEGQSAGREKIIEGPLLTVIEQTAEKAQVRTAIRRMQPNQRQAVKIWMDEVSFDQWLGWIDLLRQQNVVVSQASIVNKSPGKTDIRFTLSRS